MYISISMGGGQGSNTKDELMSLYGLLQFSAFIDISNISIFGDSKVLIEWMNGLFNLQVLSLNQWCQKVQDLRRSFKQITFMHISTIFNSRADALSKSVISLKFGLLRFQEFLEGIVIHEGEKNFIDLV